MLEVLEVLDVYGSPLAISSNRMHLLEAVKAWNSGLWSTVAGDARRFVRQIPEVTLESLLAAACRTLWSRIIPVAG